MRIIGSAQTCNPVDVGNPGVHVRRDHIVLEIMVLAEHHIDSLVDEHGTGGCFCERAVSLPFENTLVCQI